MLLVLAHDSGLDKGCVLESKHEVNKEDNASSDGEEASDDDVVGHGDGTDGDEENATDKVDEEFKDGEVGAKEVGHENGGDDDGIAYCGALKDGIKKIIEQLRVTESN